MPVLLNVPRILRHLGEALAIAASAVDGQFPLTAALIRRVVESSYYLAHRLTDMLGLFSQRNQTEQLEVCAKSPMQ